MPRLTPQQIDPNKEGYRLVRRDEAIARRDHFIVDSDIAHERQLWGGNFAPTAAVGQTPDDRGLDVHYRTLRPAR